MKEILLKKFVFIFYKIILYWKFPFTVKYDETNKVAYIFEGDVHYCSKSFL